MCSCKERDFDGGMFPGRTGATDLEVAGIGMVMILVLAQSRVKHFCTMQDPLTGRNY